MLDVLLAIAFYVLAILGAIAALCLVAAVVLVWWMNRDRVLAGGAAASPLRGLSIHLIQQDEPGATPGPVSPAPDVPAIDFSTWPAVGEGLFLSPSALHTRIRRPFGTPVPAGHANYTVVAENRDRIILRDLGPWDRYPTITNAPHSTIADLRPLPSQRVFYYDSEGEYDELLTRWVGDRAEFAGFAPARPPGGDEDVARLVRELGLQ